VSFVKAACAFETARPSPPRCISPPGDLLGPRPPLASCGITAVSRAVLAAMFAAAKPLGTARESRTTCLGVGEWNADSPACAWKLGRFGVDTAEVWNAPVRYCRVMTGKSPSRHAGRIRIWRAATPIRR